MKKIFGIMALSIFMLAVPNVQAENMKPYMGVGVGLFAIGFELSDPLTSTASQRNPTWGSFIKAGLDVNDYLGGELRVGTTGNPSTSWGANLPVGSGFVTTVSSKVSTKIDYFFSYLGKVQYPVDESFKVYGLLGGTTAKYTAALSIAGFSLPGSYTKTGLTYGAGMEFNLNEKTSLGLEWVEYWTNITLNTVGSTDKGSFRGLSATLNMAF